MEQRTFYCDATPHLNLSLGSNLAWFIQPLASPECLDTQHNDNRRNEILHNDLQHNGFVCDTQHKWHPAPQCWVSLCWVFIVMLNVIMLNIVMLSVVTPPERPKAYGKLEPLTIGWRSDQSTTALIPLAKAFWSINNTQQYKNVNCSC